MTNNNLLIIASKDLTYSHELEFLFEGVTYFQLGMEWTWEPKTPVIEIVWPNVFSDENQRKFIQENYYIIGTKLYRFNAIENQSYYVISESLKISLRQQNV